MYNAERAEFIAILDEVFIRAGNNISEDLQNRVSAFLREKRGLQRTGVFEKKGMPLAVCQIEAHIYRTLE